ncbi:ribosomal-protein-alanine acetyltransferase [Streptosporangium jomthongense]|nr:ribosomal-protein-alanine acetyltransferase [Streptosporangium jomthongense]
MWKKEDAYDPARGLELTIRSLVPGDLPQVLEIERLAYSYPWSEAVFLDCFKPDYRVWGACLGDDLVGYAVVTHILDEVHLLNLCVHPGWRGHGAGRRLVRHLLAEAVREEMNQVLLEVRLSNKVATRLYRNEGFEEIGRRPGYYPAASGWEDARVMSLLLHT